MTIVGMALDHFPSGVGRSSDELGASFLRSAIPVAATYASAAIGLAWFGGGLGAEFSRMISPLIGVPVVLIFTLSHAVLPVFFYRGFFNALQRASSAKSPHASIITGAARSFVGVHMAIWFGAPILILAALTGWLSLAWAAGHVALARRGTRAWTFVEYGSTSMALVLFLVCFSGERLFPWGLGVVVMQSLLLTILDWKARDQWISRAARASDNR